MSVALPPPGRSSPLARQPSSVLASALGVRRGGSCHFPNTHRPQSLVALATCLISFDPLCQHPAGHAQLSSQSRKEDTLSGR